MNEKTIESIIKILRAKVEMQEAANNLKSFENDVVLCSLQDELSIHVYQGIEKIADLYNLQVEISPSYKYFPLRKHSIKVMLHGYQVEFFQLVDGGIMKKYNELTCEVKDINK